MDGSGAGKKRVAIVFTGGTISMRFDAAAGGVVPKLSGKEILAQVAPLQEVAEVAVTDFARLPGPHMTPRLMLELAGAVAAILDKDPGLAGVVITHGTDTLEETAYLLDLVLGFEQPVVIVGAMRNSSELSWDGPGNLHSAVRVAIDPSARGLGVLVVMDSLILSAEDATKTETEALGTFQSRDFGPLGMVDKDRVLIMRRRAARERINAGHLEERVEIVKLSAGSDGGLIRAAVAAGARGLVIEGLGRGNIPVTSIAQVEAAAAIGIPVVITSRCPGGRVLDTYAYEGSGKHLKRMGVILGGMLPSHKARLLLMALLGAGAGVEEIRRSFEAPVSEWRA